MMDQDQLHNLEYFKYFGSMLTTDAICTREIKSRIVTEKKNTQKKKNLLPPKWTQIKTKTSQWSAAVGA